MSGTLNLQLLMQGSGKLIVPGNGLGTDSETQTLGTTVGFNFPGDGTTLGIALPEAGIAAANQWYCGVRALTATTYDLLNISSLTSGLQNGLGQKIDLTTVQAIIFVVQNADGTKHLLIGPQNQTDAWQGPWGGTTSVCYNTVYDQFMIFSPFAAGISANAIDSTHNILPVYNPTAGTIDYAIWIIGTE